MSEKTIHSERCYQHFTILQQAAKRNQLETVSIEGAIFHYGNARPHTCLAIW